MTDAFINGGRPFIGGSAAAIGLSRSALRALIAANHLRRVFLGVYVDSKVPDSRQLRAAALHLVKPEDGVFYAATVAFLRGIDAFPPRDRFDFKSHCSAPGRPLEADLGDLPRGLPAAGGSRGGRGPDRDYRGPDDGGHVAVDVATARAGRGRFDGSTRLVTREEVMRYIARMKRYPRIVQARALVVLVDPKVESPGESWQRLRLVDAGLPVPESQISILNRWGREIARLDNGYRESKIGMEYDGREWHDDVRAVADDDERRTYLRESLGWRLISSKQADIFGNDPSFERQVGEWIGMTPRARTW